MEAMARGARMGLTAGTTVIVFCAILIAAVGVLVAVMEIANAITGGKEQENDGKKDE